MMRLIVISNRIAGGNRDCDGWTCADGPNY